MKVEADFVCEHGMPQPWVTCHECMFLPFDQRPVPPKPKPEPPKPKPTRAAKRKPSSTGAASDKVSSKNPARKAAAPASSRTLPKSVDGESPQLIGDKDLAYEIPENHLRYHVQGTDKNWLPISTMPTELRDRGWVYLKSDDHVVARCRVKGVGYRDQRWSHEHPDTTSDVGPGATLELDGDWEFLSVDVGLDGTVEIRGYQYLVTGNDGVVRPALRADA